MTKWYIQDDHHQAMSPLCDLRATFEQRTGGVTTLERLTRDQGSAPAGFLCDDDLRAEMIAQRTGLQRVTDEQGVSGGDQTINTPWDILEHLPTLLKDDLEYAEPIDGTCVAQTFGDHRIDIHPSATLFPTTVLDASNGAIRIEANVVIRPNAVIIGPCWIGEGSTIYEAGIIKANTSIGPCCKVSGEVGGTIFQGYANKCHNGHLGDSVIGEWVNFGAGTTNSNLLNTYGEIVVMDLDGNRHKTGRKYVGCFVGDHVKFAINTRIMTGSMIGTGAMIATSTPAPSPTPRFAWLTDGDSRTYRTSKFLDVARTVMARRNRELDAATEAVIQRLADS
jgi:UDP-N-acetylglucosamine diphosphorylase/glucosamine-1-phosphate N-acetyltransferase